MKAIDSGVEGDEEEGLEEGGEKEEEGDVVSRECSSHRRPRLSPDQTDAPYHVLCVTGVIRTDITPISAQIQRRENRCTWMHTRSLLLKHPKLSEMRLEMRLTRRHKKMKARWKKRQSRKKRRTKEQTRRRLSA